MALSGLFGCFFSVFFPVFFLFFLGRGGGGDQTMRNYIRAGLFSILYGLIQSFEIILSMPVCERHIMKIMKYVVRRMFGSIFRQFFQSNSGPQSVGS